jgi:hypothetical protein
MANPFEVQQAPTATFNSLMRGIDTEEIANNGLSIEDSYSDYATYGVAGAATSAVVGIVNSVAALGNSLGADFQYYDEREAIDNFVGDKAAQFYDRHKSGVDITGMILGTMVPGMFAVKGLRALQVAGKVGPGVELATGMKNADLVLGTQAVRNARAAVMAGETYNIGQPAVWRAYAAGAVQQAKEAIVFETAATVLNNQNSTLNPDDMAAWDSITATMWDNKWFLVGGTAISGGFEALKIRGFLRGEREAANLKTGHLAHPNLGNIEYSTPGEQIMSVLSERNKFLNSKEYDTAIEGVDEAYSARRKAKGLEALNDRLINAVTRLDNTADADGLNLIKRLVGKEGQEADIEKLSGMLSGLTGVGNFSAKEIEKQLAFYQNTVAPWRVLEVNGPANARAKVAQILQDSGELTEKEMARVLDGSQGTFDNLDEITAGMNVGKLPDQAHYFKAPFKSFMQYRERGSVKGIFGTIYTNKEAMEANFPAWQTAVKELKGKDATFQEFQDYVLFHELGHSKSNRHEVLKTVMEGKKTNNKLLQELEKLSRTARPDSWNDMDEFVKEVATRRGEKPESIWKVFYGDPQEQSYLLRSTELMADSAALLVNPASREWASKVAPNVAKLLQEHGGLAAPWKDTKLFYNARTGEFLTSMLPAANDVGRVALGKNGMITIKGFDKSFKYNDAAWDQDVLLFRTEVPDYMEYSSMWAAAGTEDIAKYYDESLDAHVVKSTDLARIERFITDDSVKQISLKQPDGSNLNASKEALKDMLVSQKQFLRDKLQGQYRYNEQEIAHILNIDNSRALGLDAGEWITMGQKDFTKAESFVMSYTDINPQDVNISSKSFAASKFRGKIQYDMQQKAAAVLLGKMYDQMPEINAADAMKYLSDTEGRVGKITALRTKTGGLRDTAAYVQKQLSNYIKGRQQDVATHFEQFHHHFNRPENYTQRAELSLLTNNLRRDWYVMHTAEAADGTIQRYAVKESTYEGLKMLAKEGKDIAEDLEAYAAQKSGETFKLTKEVGEFMSLHQKMNSGLIDRKMALNNAKGRFSKYNAQRLYPPPHDLRETPYFAFVLPKELTEGAEPQKFMVFGSTAQELDEKISYIKSNYNTSHDVLQKGDIIVRTQGQVTDFKKMIQEYDRGAVFNEMEFDPNLVRRGSAQELNPTVDVSYSRTLDMFRTWHYRQEEFLARAGVEMKYQELFTGLRSADKAYSTSIRATVTGQKEADTIFKDTLQLMLDDRGYNGEAEFLWKRINGMVGDTGSKVIDAATAPFRGARVQFPSAEFDKYNSTLEAAGYNPPFKNVIEMNLSSKDPNVSRSLNKIVQTMNNTVSTLMLSLDWANSIIQTISTPILLSPVIREARQALDGEMRAKLDSLTTVINPANGKAEPTVMKLITTGTKNYFTKEGKEFLAELQSRNIVMDTLREWHEVTDFTIFNGNHTLEAVSTRVEKMVEFGKKMSGYQHSEEFSRYLVADCARQICEIRGIKGEEMYAIASGMVDKVLGQYRGTTRPQLFNGVVGQAIGLYQTYMFNFMQNAFHWGMTGDKKNLAILAAMQGSVYGLRSYPGFSTFNQWVGEANRNNEDVYSATGANTPGSLASYAMYGLGSHALGIPMDLFSRGDMTVRNNLIIPTQVQDIPAVAIASKVVANIANTVKLLAGDTAPNADALAFGLAHNGFNRPLQGIGNIILNRTTSGQATPYETDINYIDGEGMEELNVSGMFTRALGTKPLDEAILLDNMFRQKAYQAASRKKAEELGMGIKLQLASGTPVTAEQIDDYALKYEKSGNDIENFNAFFGRQLTTANQGVLDTFRNQMEVDSTTRRAYSRMQLERSTTPPWSEE